MSKPLIKPTAAGRILGVSERTVRVWCSEGKLPHYDILGNYLFDEDELKAWRESRHRKPVGA